MVFARTRPRLGLRLVALAMLTAAGLSVWMAGSGPDGDRALTRQEGVLVSVSLLDLSRLAPAAFGDWETAPVQPAHD